jgi:hypothetical protein
MTSSFGQTKYRFVFKIQKQSLHAENSLPSLKNKNFNFDKDRALQINKNLPHTSLILTTPTTTATTTPKTTPTTTTPAISTTQTAIPTKISTTLTTTTLPITTLTTTTALTPTQVLPTHRALVIGIGYHAQSDDFDLGPNPLYDASAMQRLVCKHLCIQNQKRLTEETIDKPTYDTIIKEIRTLIASPENGNHYYMHFSGHCQQIINSCPSGTLYHDNTDFEDNQNNQNNQTNQNNQNNEKQKKRVGKNDALITMDMRFLTCEEMYNELVQPLHNTGASLLVTVDACQSGTCLNLPFNYRVNSDRTAVKPVRGAGFFEEPKPLNCDVVLLSACTDWQYAKNGGNGKHLGAMTNATTTVLENFGSEITLERLLVEIQLHLDREHIRQDVQMSSMRELDFTKTFASFHSFDSFGACKLKKKVLL